MKYAILALGLAAWGAALLVLCIVLVLPMMVWERFAKGKD